MNIFTFELYDLFNGFLGNREIEAHDENEATEKLESDLADEGETLEYDLTPTLAQACADIELQQSWKDEKFMEELDSQMSLADLEQAAWNAYRAGICPCGDPKCGGLKWLLKDNDPFEF